MHPVCSADDGCWHLEGYPHPPEHQKHHVHEDWEIVSPETCKNESDHPFCWGDENNNDNVMKSLVLITIVVWSSIGIILSVEVVANASLNDKPATDYTCFFDS
jgi:hypothetical protein